MIENHEITTLPQPSQPDNSNYKKAASMLRILSPIRMRRITEELKQRTELLDLLNRDDEKHFLRTNRYSVVLGIHGTEGSIVHESLKGLLEDTIVTQSLWAEVISGLGHVVGEVRRAGMYRTLVNAKEESIDPFKISRINKILHDFSSFDPTIAERAFDDEYFVENMMNMTANMLQDTFSNLF